MLCPPSIVNPGLTRVKTRNSSSTRGLTRACPGCGGWRNMSSLNFGNTLDRTTPASSATPASASPLITGSDEQEAIWDFLLKGGSHGVVQARAGTGKTFTLIQAALRLPRSIRCGIFSFNRHIVQELSAQLQHLGITWVRAHTYHSFGNSLLYRNLPVKPTLQDHKLSRIIEQYGSELY